MIQFSGVDDVFVFINVFRQADHIKSAGSRVWFTMVTAGKATFFTSFTTAAAFAANIASMVCILFCLHEHLTVRNVMVPESSTSNQCKSTLIYF